ncbi:MAG TPA: lipoyl synthase [candidate division Zixibacteria bacterium]|nr:lipoyl synthase [candidate division Zixibacteria bacterium]
MSKKTNKIRKPGWLKVKTCGDKRYLETMSLIRNNRLETVCQQANCPNRGECFSSGTATFLILGNICTRNCSFCNITTGRPRPVDDDEPNRVAGAVKILNLEHAVITSVTRDDLTDGGAEQFVRVIDSIRRLNNKVTIEVLTPDFRGSRENILKVLKAEPDVYNHNIETVPRLYPAVRPAADYRQSLRLLKLISNGKTAVKSGIMVGLGETVDELNSVFVDMNEAGVEYLTIGQYLAPSQKHHPIIKYYEPSEFDNLAESARRAGIRSVFSAPLVRSSYHAKEIFHS